MSKEKIKKALANKKVIVGIIIIVALIAALLVHNILTGKNNNKKTPANIAELTKEKVYGNLKFSDIEVISTDDLNHIALNITNTSNEPFKQEFVKITFKNKNGEKIDTVEAIIPDIDGNATSRLDMVVEEKVLDAYTFTVKKIKQ